jgi:hypothetical protein
MLLKLGNHIANCLRRAADAEQRALNAENQAARSDDELLARSWRNLAKSYQFVESLERFILDLERAKQAIPPQLAAVLRDQPDPPEARKEAGPHFAMDGSTDKSWMNIIFICPHTDLKTQYCFESSSERDDEYEAVTCPACTRVHLINRKSGKLLGQK